MAGEERRVIPMKPQPGHCPQKHETEPGGITYDRFRLARLQQRLAGRLGIRTVVEVPASGAKACPSLYAIGFGLAGCRVTLVDPYRPAFADWHRLGLTDRLTSVSSGVDRLPFRDGSFDLAFNFVTLGAHEDLESALAEMARVANTVLLVMQNGYNLGYPWHRLLHRLFGFPWDHGQTRYFFPAELSAAMRHAGIGQVEIGLIDQAPWPDPPGFRDVRLHRSGIPTMNPREVEWTVPAVIHFASGRFPLWMRILGFIEELPIPLTLRWPFNHLYYALGFSGPPVTEEARLTPSV
jgi:hypothetical protein